MDDMEEKRSRICTEFLGVADIHSIGETDGTIEVYTENDSTPNFQRALTDLETIASPHPVKVIRCNKPKQAI